MLVFTKEVGGGREGEVKRPSWTGAIATDKKQMLDMYQ